MEYYKLSNTGEDLDAAITRATQGFAQADAVTAEMQQLIDEVEDKLENGDFDGPQGVSGVYVGTDPMPEGYNVQINPEGTVICYDATESDGRYANAVTGEGEGQPATLTDAWVGGTLSKCEIIGQTTETGTGDKSPDNPYEISGVQPASVTMCGKNYLPCKGESTTKTSNGVTMTDHGDGTYTFNGTVTGDYAWLSTGNASFYPPGKYTLNVENMPNNTNCIAMIYNSDAGTGFSQTGNTPKTFEITTNIRYGFAYRFEVGVVLENVTVRAMLSRGESAEEFEPYSGQTETLPEIEPLYHVGETCDSYEAVSGKVIRKTVRIELDGTTDQFRNTTAAPPEGYASVITSGRAIRWQGGGIICSSFPADSQDKVATADQEFCWKHNNLNAFAFVVNIERLAAYGATADRATYASAFQQYLAAQKESGTPVTVVLELAEPESETVTGVPVKVTDASASVYADTAAVHLIYTKDTNLVIGQLLDRVAALEGDA